MPFWCTLACTHYHSPSFISTFAQCKCIAIYCNFAVQCLTTQIQKRHAGKSGEDFAKKFRIWWDAGITFGCPTAWTRGTHCHIAAFWHFCSQKVVYRKYFFCTFFFIWKKLSFGFEGFPHSPSFDFYFWHRAQCKLYFCSAAPTILTFFAHTNTQNSFFLNLPKVWFKSKFNSNSHTWQ